jgi:hypothetical protein
MFCLPRDLSERRIIYEKFATEYTEYTEINAPQSSAFRVLRGEMHFFMLDKAKCRRISYLQFSRITELDTGNALAPG